MVAEKPKAHTTIGGSGTVEELLQLMVRLLNVNTMSIRPKRSGGCDCAFDNEEGLNPFVGRDDARV